jgi:2-oxoglutarate ferredoxin oxidoreductase subunit delta
MQIVFIRNNLTGKDIVMTELSPKSSSAEAKNTKSVKILIDISRCKGCGFCTEFCPREVLAMSQEINSKGYTPAKVVEESKCPGCELCEIMCPEFAIRVVRH